MLSALKGEKAGC